MARTEEQAERLRARIREIDSWYHAIDLGGGVWTPGPFDMARYLPHYRFPEDLSGKRVLDVGASNGFFSVEFERRGADEVVSIDLPNWAAHDWTPRWRTHILSHDPEKLAELDRKVMRSGFDLVVGELGQGRIQKVEVPIYDLDPDALGRFDLVFCGSMLMHVRDPVLGVQRMRAMCAPDGRLIISIATALEDQDEPVARFVGEWNQCNWWQMNPACLDAVLTCCDFGQIENRDRFVLRDTNGAFEDPTYVCHALPRA